MPYKSVPSELNNIASFIHESALDPHVNFNYLRQICEACNHFNFDGLCTNLIRIESARQFLGKNKTTKLIAVIAFPFGDIPYNMKRSQAEWAAEHGADELDIVPNFLHLHENKIEEFAEEIAGIISIGLPSRIILDTMKIHKEKLALSIDAAIDAGAIGIQTGNGFGPPINSLHLKELASLVKNRCSIKAAGGIKKLDQVLGLIKAGASSIGTSVGSDIAQDFKLFMKNNEY